MWDKKKMSRQLREHAKLVRLIASDLDGTLFYAGSAVSARTEKVLDMARAHGVDFTICTGRSPYELGDLPERLRLTAPVICRNGAEIVDPTDRRTLHRQLISTDESTSFLRFCIREQIDVCLCTQDAVLFPKKSFFSSFFLPPPQGPKYVSLEEVVPLETLEHYKLILPVKQAKYAGARAFLDQCPGIRRTAASGEIDDLISINAHKGSGLQWVAEYLGLSGENCCAFGDFINDVPMFQYVGLSFAMENAAPDVQAAAGFVAPANTDDGVAQALEALFGE